MKLGLALVGAGEVIRSRHLPALAALDHFQVRSVYDPDQRAAEAVATSTGARVAATLDQAARAQDVEAVTVASPNAFHRAGVEAAAAAGKHVLCEKPIATTLRDARAMIEAAERAGVVLQLGFHHRFTSEFRLARRLLESGVIGGVRAFQAVISEPMSLVPKGNYRLREEVSGGLTLIDFGSHRLDQLRALLGEAEEVSALLSCAGPGHHLDDNVTLAIRTRAGALGALGVHRFSRGAFTPTVLLGDQGMLCFGSYVVNPFQAAPVAVFSEAPLPVEFLDLRRAADWWNPPSAGWTALWPPVVNPYVAEYEAFLRAIRGGAPPEPSGRDGYQTLEIVIAAYKSFLEGRVVRLPLDPEEDVPIPVFRESE